MIRSLLTTAFLLSLTAILVCHPHRTCTAQPTSNPSSDLELISCERIWNQAPHNAFTDLVRFNDCWFCVFREGSGHVSPDGAIRVLTSADSMAWKSAALITSPIADLRDPKITLTPTGNLMITAAGALHDRSQNSHQTFVWFSPDGTNWSDPTAIGQPNNWLWRITWHQQSAFGFGYSCSQDKHIKLFNSLDGKNFLPNTQEAIAEGNPNESSIIFTNNQAVCLLRRDTQSGTGLLGFSSAPFTKWQWHDLNIRIGGPHLIQIPDGRLLAAVRLYDGKTRTSLCWIDPDRKSLTEALSLPSGGDTSYAGLAIHDNILHVSYYSSHEGKTSIYFAKIRITPQVLDIGSRRELFVDHYLINHLENANLKLHSPRLAEPMTEPANSLEYGTVIQDGDLFRLYTREGRGAKFDGDSSEVTRYCESRDGIHWTRPDLGLIEIDGSKNNNVILNEPPFCHNFAPFLDRNPRCPPEQRFKALAGTVKSGLVAFTSPDGIHWSKVQPDPVIQYTKEYAFDSQNVSFWSESENCYVCYFRHFLDNKLRSVCRTQSDDFLHWSEPVPLKPNFPGEHIYTTLTQPYFRAPHIYIATPTRFHPDRGESTDILFMTTRGSKPFDRTFREAWIRPGIDPNRWGNRSNYAAWNVVPTSTEEMSIYTTPFRRFVLRTDGFASLNTGADIGEMQTKPIRFDGTQLELNFSTSAGGNIRIELQDLYGKPLPGFELSQCEPIVGDSISQNVRWKNQSSLESVSNTVIRLRFVLQEADIFSFRFYNPATAAP